MDVSLSVAPGETVGVVGESGSGKSTLARCMALLELPDAGRVMFAGEDLMALPRAGLRRRRRQIQIIFQNPFASLNPTLRIGDALAEVLRFHGRVARGRVQARVRELLDQVGLPPSAARRYPRDFSGGQRQRICIARALLRNALDYVPRKVDDDCPRELRWLYDRLDCGRSQSRCTRTGSRRTATSTWTTCASTRRRPCAWRRDAYPIALWTTLRVAHRGPPPQTTTQFAEDSGHNSPTRQHAIVVRTATPGCRYSHDRRRRGRGACRQQSKLRRLEAERALHDRSADQRALGRHRNQAPVPVGHFQHRRSYSVPDVRRHAEPASPGQ
jgi:ABC-type uncharacterized transport system YnjBCD ATPase subunit